MKQTFTYDDTCHALFAGELVKKHSGWTNYETWAVHLWLSNDEASYGMAREVVSEDEDYEAAEALNQWVKDMQEEAIGGFSASIFTDLLTAALDDVNWLEVARAFRKE